MAVPEQWRFVIQPWKEYPPAVASMRVLNTDEDGHTILFLEPMWAFGRRVYAEDEIITIPTVNGRGNTMTVPLGRGSVYGFMQRNQAPTDERFAFLTYAVTDPTKHGLHPQTAITITPADAVSLKVSVTLVVLISIPEELASSFTYVKFLALIFLILRVSLPALVRVTS